MKLPLFGAGLQGKSATVTAQTRVNCYAEIQPQGDKSQIAFYGTPGLATAFTNFGATPTRGAWAVDPYLYCVHRNTLYQVDNTGAQVSCGTLNTSEGKVDIRDNGIELLIVDGTNGYTYNLSTGTFAQVADADFPNGATTAAWQDGYFIVEKDNDFAISTLDDGTSWDATKRASAEGNPDDIQRVYADHGEAILLGPKTSEFWANSGAQDFPYTRVPGGVIEWGLAAKWSLAKFQSSLMWLGQNRMGQAQVVLLDGYTPKAVSTPELDYIINSTDFTNATGLSYSWYGHPFYQLNLVNRSFFYDGSNGIWGELQNGAGGRHRAEIANNFLGNVVVTDYETGALYRLSDTAYTDDGTPIIRRLRSRHLQDSAYITVSSLWLDFETGVGNSSVENPQVMLRVSKDGGRSWSSEIFASIGKVGEYTKRAMWRRLGRARDWVFEVTVSDAVKFALVGEGWLE